MGNCAQHLGLNKVQTCQIESPKAKMNEPRADRPLKVLVWIDYEGWYFFYGENDAQI